MSYNKAISDLDIAFISGSGRPSVRRNASWALVGNCVYVSCQWTMVVLLAKLGSPQMVGQLTLGFAICAPVFMFSNLQLRQVQATDARREYRFREYVSLRLLGTLLALVVIGGIVVLSEYPNDTRSVILLVGVAKAIESLADVLYGRLQQREQMDLIAKSMIVRGILAVVGIGLGVFLTGQLLWGVAGLVAAGIITLALYDLPQGARLLVRWRRQIGERDIPYTCMKAGSEAQWSLRRIGQLAWTSIPLAIVMTLNSLSGNIPRYFVGAHMGERELGIFMAMAYLMVVPGTIMSAFFQSTSPRLSKLDAESKELAFRALVRRLTVTGALVGAAGIVVALFASPGILTLLYRPEYAKQPDVLVWLMVAAGVQCVGGAFSVATTSLRQFWVQAPVEALSVIITVTVVAASVPRWGLVGAAWALLAASGLSRACVYVLLRSRLDRRWTQG